MRSSALTLILLFPVAAIASDATADDLMEAGRSIYYAAMRPDGSPVHATVQQDVSLPAGAGACVSCHRRSGLGVAEGGARALDITGRSLFSAREVPPERAAYDDELLVRAIVAGIDANGDPLSDLMPRYQLTADDAAALSAYLRRLGTEPVPGVTDTDLILATIITPDSSDAERQALEAVIPQYLAVKNGGSRQESRRSIASSRHFYGIKRYQAYREWKHSFWVLEGPPETWSAQLRERYEQSPPFAILSGSLGSHAGVISDFCENYEIACVLPLTDSPTGEGSGFYTLYFSAGTRLELDVLASYLGDPATAPTLVYQEDDYGRAAQALLSDRLSATGIKVRARGVPPGRKLSVNEWNRLLRGSTSDTMVLLLPQSQLENLMHPNLDMRMLPARIVTAEAFTDWSKAHNAGMIADRVVHIYPYSLERPGLSQFPREDVWLKSRGIQTVSHVEAAKVLFACKALGMALSDIQSNFSREYLLESLEHALDNNLMTSLYPRTTLGPDQRFLSRGAYVGHLTLNAGRAAVTEGIWVQP